jgi:general secretion pathway protein B
VHEPVKRPVWPYLILAGLIINALLIAAWFKPWEAKEKEPVKIVMNSEAPLTAPEAAETEVPIETPVELTVIEKTVEQVVPKTEEAITDKEAAAPLLPEPPAVEEAAAEKSSFEFSSGSEDAPAESYTFPSGSSDGPLELSALPLSVREELPEISISAHIYSNRPSSRIVNINGHILREGGKINPDLLVDEITETGVILKHSGYRFRMRGL